MTIAVNHLRFHSDAPIHDDDDDYKKVFVEYRFLDVPPQETETPFALPRTSADVNINYNFSKGMLCANRRGLNM